MTTKLKVIAAALTASFAVFGVTQIASAQTAPARPTPTVSTNLQAQAKPAQTTDVAEVGDTADMPGAAEVADPAEAGDTPDVAGAADTAEAGDVADAAEPAGGADTDNVQDGDQSGPETPDAPGASTK